MNTQEQIVAPEAEKESGEYALQVADETFHTDEESVYNTPEVVESVLTNESVKEFENGAEFQNALDELMIPDEVLPAEKAPKLTAQQIKAINVQGSGAIFHRATPQHNLGKKSSNNSSKKVSKKAEKKAKESRKKNRKIASKKFRPSGSKKRK